MMDVPYFCPECRSNRVKFNVITKLSQPIMKDAITGALIESGEMMEVQQSESTILCRVCGFEGNEMRFIKQAEREPRTPTPIM